MNRAPLTKTYPASAPIVTLTPARVLTLPLVSRPGTATPCVETGSTVTAGQVVARYSGAPGLAIASPAAGTVRVISRQTLQVERNLQESSKETATNTPATAPPSAPEDAAGLRRLLADNGIVGLGGGGFATHTKFESPVDTLIINAVECEPELSSDLSCIEREPAALAACAAWLQNLLAIPRCIIALARNNAAGITRLSPHLSSGVTLTLVADQYPAGSERQLVKAVTGISLARHERPATRRIVCLNTGTLAAIGHAVFAGQPLTHRVITAYGDACHSPGNYLVEMGTPLAHIRKLLTHPGTPVTLIEGGRLTGREVDDSSVVSAATIGIGFDPVAKASHAEPCIRCGDCARVCPENLEPQLLYAARGAGERAALALDACLLCGACTVVCPSRINLNESFRQALASDAEVLAAAERAVRQQLRFAAHEARLARQAERDQQRLRDKRKRGKAKDLIKAALGRTQQT